VSIKVSKKETEHLSKGQIEQRKMFMKVIHTLKGKKEAKLVQLSKIEKMVKMSIYKTLADFGNDVRRVINEAFSLHITNGEAFNSIMKVSTDFEKMFGDLEKPNIKKKAKTILDLKKRVSELNKEIKNYSLSTKVVVPKKTYTRTNELKISKKEKLNLFNKINHLSYDQKLSIIRTFPELASQNSEMN
jgi:hypothetical protein